MFSVIIPAKNEADNITRCIKSIFLSIDNSLKLEVIVIDNGSCDDTVKLAEKAGALVYFDQEKNISGLRNLGAQKSQYEYLAFLDADCEVPKNWLSNAFKLLDKKKVGIVGEFPKIPEENVSWIEKTMYGVRPSSQREVNYLGSCNMIIKKSDFNKVGGFNELAITGEDYILCQNIKNIGLTVIASPELSVFHYGYPKTLKAFLKREIWHGIGMLDLYRAGRLTLPLVWALLNICILSIILVALCTNKLNIVIVAMLVLLILPLGATLQRMNRRNNWDNFLKLYVIIITYGYARTISLIRIILSEFHRALRGRLEQ